MRNFSKNLDKMIGVEHKVLDHGFIRVVDYMGNDSSIVEAARVSYAKGTKKVRDDEKLIHYLLKHEHMGPFEMCEIKFHIKLPIFVARQWIRHRTANVNEQSARYSVLDNDFYVPDDFKGQSASNKQASSESLGKELSCAFNKNVTDHSSKSFELYEFLIGKGVSREIARTVLPINIYTEWYWKIDLRNLFHFLLLRMGKGAQFEIREYAIKILEIVSIWVPFSTEAFKKYHLNSVRLCSDSIQFLKSSIKNKEKQDISETSLTKSDYQNLSFFFEDIDIF